jgi:hypothetical protein
MSAMRLVENVTLLIGWKQPGMNVIFADARMTRRRNGAEVSGENHSLKTGLLFPGCIFGRTGHVAASARFIAEWHRETPDKTGRPEELWALFCEFAAGYAFPELPEMHFQLLLSHRAAGAPKFALLDSETGLTALEEEHPVAAIAYGSGAQVEAIQDAFKRVFPERLRELVAYLDERGRDSSFTAFAAPLFVSLWLSELSLTWESIDLERGGVGGVFHFLLQMDGGEATQPPAVFVFADLVGSKVNLWCYRIVPVVGCLYVERYVPPGQDGPDSPPYCEKEVYADPTSRPDLDELSDTELDAELRRALNDMPFFQFLGIGFTRPHHRLSIGFSLKPDGKRDEIWDAEGNLQPFWKDVILSNYGPPTQSEGSA